MNNLTFANLNYVKIKQENINDQADGAKIRDEFFEQNNFVIRAQLFADLKPYYSDKDISYMIPQTLDYYVETFLDKQCNVYDNAPIVTYKDPKDETLSKIQDLLNEVNWPMQRHQAFMRTKLHNTIVSYTRYSESLDKFWIENLYNVGTCKVVPYKNMQNEMRYFCREILGHDGETAWEIWDLETKENYYLSNIDHFDEGSYTFLAGSDDKSMTANKINVDPDSDSTNHVFDAYNPLTVYRYREHNGFWGNGFDSLINLVRNINILLTVTQDDTIQNSIRLLIMNFNPDGTENEKNEIKVGMRHPVRAVPNPASKVAPSAQLISGDLYTDKIVEFVKDLSDMATAIQDMPSMLKQQVQAELSGIALRIRNEPKMQKWSRDKSVVREQDKHQIIELIKANNHHRSEDAKKKIDEKVFDTLTVQYREPKMITDEKADYELAQLKFRDGTDSIVEYMKRIHTGIDDKKAEEMIRDNIAKNKEFGISNDPFADAVNNDK